MFSFPANLFLITILIHLSFFCIVLNPMINTHILHVL